MGHDIGPFFSKALFEGVRSRWLYNVVGAIFFTPKLRLESYSQWLGRPRG